MVGEFIIKYLLDNYLLIFTLIGIIYLFSLPHHILRKERICLILSVAICGFLSIVTYLLYQYGISNLPTWFSTLLFFLVCAGTPFISCFFFYAVSGIKSRFAYIIPCLVNVLIFVVYLLIFKKTYSIVDGKIVLGTLFYISVCFVLGYMIVSLILGIVKKSTDKITLSSFIIASIIATGLVFYIKGNVNVIYTVSTIIAAFIYFYKYYVYDTQFQAQEIKKKQIALAVSQIQPHFIFNALNSIYALIDSDVYKAKKVLNDFSTYLRVNIDSLSTSEPIDFDRELEHIESYVSIEKIRFNERLNMKYNIQFKNFKIAPLTLQPLVENAIRHGICKKKQGGTVLIATKRINDFVEIRIEDDGAGFDTSAPIDTNVHTGFTNVKDRVEGLYKGTFIYSSEIGVGTKIKILLPLIK